MAWLSGYSKRKPITITGGASGAFTDFQLKLAAAYAAAMQSDFDDLRFTQSDGTTLIDAWLETKTDDTSATIWAEFPTTPANTVESTYYMYYGNVGAASDWDGAATFLQWHGAATSSFIDSLNVSPACIFESRSKTTGSSVIRWGMANNQSPTTDDCQFIMSHHSANLRYIQCNNEGAASSKYESPEFVQDTWYNIKIINTGTTITGFVDDNQISTGDITTNIPNENLGLFMQNHTSTGAQDWSFARKYAANPPTYAFGSEESVPNSYWYYEMLKRRNS